MHFMEVEAWQGLKPAKNPSRLRGAEAPLFHKSKFVLYNLCGALPRE
jgi:hypothetical protein